jgi:hypothetical protein
MPFHRIARHRVLAMGVAPSAAGDDLTACDEVLAAARQILHGAVDVEPAWTLPDFDASLLSGGNPQEKTARLDWQPVSRRPTLTLVPTDMYGPPPVCKWIDASRSQAVCCNVSGP